MKKLNILQNLLSEFNLEVSSKTSASVSASYSTDGFSATRIKQARVVRETCERLGHPGPEGLKELLSQECITELNITREQIEMADVILGKCIGCLAGKTTRERIVYTYPVTAKNVGEIVHIDFMFLPAPHSTTSPYLVAYDTFSGFISVYHTMRRTTNMSIDGIVQLNLEYKSSNNNISTIICDREKVFETVKAQLMIQGIKIKQTAAERHACGVERMIRVIKERMRAIITTLPYQLPVSLYPSLVQHVVQMINIVPRKAKQGTRLIKRSSYQIFHASDKSINASVDLRYAYGQYGHAFTMNTSNNLQSRVEPVIVLGNELENSGALSCLSLNSFRIVSRDKLYTRTIEKHHINKMNDRAKQEGGAHIDILHTNSNIMNDIQASTSILPLDDHETDEFIINENEDRGYDPLIFESDHDSENDDEITDQKDEEYHPPAPISITQSNVTSIHNTNEPRRSERIRDKNRSESINTITYTIKGAKKQGQSHIIDEAVHKELDAILQMKVYEYVMTSEIPNGAKIMPSFLFMTLKTEQDIQRWKARLVCCGNYGLDPEQGYSAPTTGNEVINCVLSVAVQKSFKFRVIDIGTAFLHSELPKDLNYFMRINKDIADILINKDPMLDRFRGVNGCIYVKLLRGIYGLKEAAALWFKNISETLMEDGWIQSKHDDCLFTKKDSAIIIHVDDLLVGSTEDSILDEVQLLLKRKYKNIKVQNSDHLEYLKMKININRKDGNVTSITLDQQSFTEQIINQHPVHKSASTPATRSLYEEIESPRCDQGIYASMLMKLNYLAIHTRFEIAFAIAYLATKIQSCTDHNMKQVNRIYAYLATNTKIGLTFTKQMQDEVIAFADSSHASHSDGYGHSGSIILYGTNPLASKSGKQKSIARSACASELIAVDKCVLLLMHIQGVMNELGCSKKPIKLMQDNASTMQLINNGTSSAIQTRCLRPKLAFLKEKINEKLFYLCWCPTEEMIADVLTKVITGDKFNWLREKLLNIQEIHQ